MSRGARAIVEGHRPQGAGQKLLAGGLSGVSILYDAVAALRGWSYRKGLARSYSLSCPVFCVGNLTLGGTGKTPVAAVVCRMLLDLGRRPAIVSRGYGGKKRKNEIVVASEGDGPIAEPHRTGDEPYLLATLLRNVPIVACADRQRGAREAIDRFGADCIVLDDGFQHFRLKRDFDFVLLDASRDPETMRLFPRGPLRERFSGLRRAAAIGLTRVDNASHLDQWRAIAARWAPQTPVFDIRFPAAGLVSDSGRGETFPVDVLRDRKILAVAAIGHPQAFRATLENLGAKIQGNRVFPDHHRYTQDDLTAIDNAARESDSEWIVTTDKDTIKWRGLKPPTVPCHVLRIGADFGEKANDLANLMNRCFED